MTNPDLRIISLGGGVQSTAMTLMFEEGRFGYRPDAALFADTGWEPSYVYATVAAITERVSFPVKIVSDRNLQDDVRSGKQGNRDFISIPLFFRPGGDGKVTMGVRNCTTQYKTRPLIKGIREMLGVGYGKQVPKGTIVEHYMGLSEDEAGRVKPNQKLYIHNRYPLLEQGLTRADCQIFLDKYYADIPVGKSACKGCPYASNAFYRNLASRFPDEWDEVCELDRAIRNHKPDGELFLHRSGLPLADAVQITGEQADLFDNECSGHCGI